MNTFKPTFNKVTIQSILSDLHNKKITVIVPEVALFSDAEISVQKEVTYFVDNAPITSKRTLGNDVIYTDTLDSVVDDEKNEKSKMNRTTVRLSVSVVIDLFHKQFSIYIPKQNNDLPKLVEFMNEILNRLENSSDKRAKELFNYVNEFYETVIKNQKTNIAKNFSLDATHLPGMKPVVGFTESLMEEDNINKATFIDIDSITV